MFKLAIAATATGALFASPALAQDECVSAIPVGNETLLGDLVDNLGLSGDDSSCAFNDLTDEWYSYTAGGDGMLRVTTCNPGTIFDTTLSAFFDCANTEIVCNDDTVGAPTECQLGPTNLNRKSTIEFAVTNGTTYFVRVAPWNDSFSTQGGSGTVFEITFDGPPIAPSCACDWNNDGFLNNSDFFDWVNDFFSQSGPQGQFDFNEDGFQNEQDWFDFVNCFFTPPAGCPIV